jgi:hypothetical protein
MNKKKVLFHQGSYVQVYQNKKFMTSNLLKQEKYATEKGWNRAGDELSKGLVQRKSEKGYSRNQNV